MAVLLVLFSCESYQKDYEFLESLESSKIEISVQSSNDVSLEMLERVIADKRPDVVKSRAKEYTVNAINGEDGTPLIYVVNFKNNRGFMLISAKQSYHPVIAFADEGSYAVSDKDSNLAFYQGLLLDNVQQSTCLPEDSIRKFKYEWLRYKTCGDSIISRDRPSDAMPDYWDEQDYANYNRIRQIMMDSTAAILNRTGYEIYFPDESNQKFLSKYDPMVIEQALNACQGAVFYRYEDIWKKVSFIVYHPYGGTVIRPNLVKSQWHQGSPYNKSMPDYVNVEYNMTNYHLGCWTVAVGQVMRYYNWPDNIAWDNMPIEHGNSKYTQDFLAKLANDADCKCDGVFTHINDGDMMDALKKYEYRTSKSTNLNEVACSDYILSGKPVIIAGKNKKNGHGHAWIASGYRGVYDYADMDVYAAVQPTKFVYDSSIGLRRNCHVYLYMNWGWGVNQGNGYYVLDNLTPPNRDYEQSSLRFYIIEPNK